MRDVWRRAPLRDSNIWNPLTSTGTAIVCGNSIEGVAMFDSHGNGRRPSAAGHGLTGWPTGESGAIAVIGAGIAGLVAAYELERLGHRVVVLEGSSRIGGRIYTHRFGSVSRAPAAELGAMRIPIHHALTMRYVDHLGLRSALRPFHTILSDANNYVAIGARYARLSEAAEPLIDEVRRLIPATVDYRYETVVFGAWLCAFIRAIGPRELRDSLATDIRDVLRLADRIDLRPYLSTQSHRIDIGAVFRGQPELRDGCGRRLSGFLDDLLIETSTDLVYLNGGMSQLTSGLTRRIGGPLLMRQRVVSLAVQRDGVRVDVFNGKREWTEKYPMVLCTVPFSVLRTMTLTGVDDDKIDVVRSMDYGAATKVALYCREPFWVLDGIRGGASAIGGRSRQAYYPTAGTVLLGSYAIAEDADLLGHLPARARHEAVREELSALHPELRRPDMVLDAASMAWGEHPWSLGCTARRWGKDAAQRADEMHRASRPQGRLFFAGEHCSSAPAWIDGAIESALHAVAQINEMARAILPRTLAKSAVEE
jgi:monoamine oxidase